MQLHWTAPVQKWTTAGYLASCCVMSWSGAILKRANWKNMLQTTWRTISGNEAWLQNAGSNVWGECSLVWDKQSGQGAAHAGEGAAFQTAAASFRSSHSPQEDWPPVLTEWTRLIYTRHFNCVKRGEGNPLYLHGSSFNATFPNYAQGCLVPKSRCLMRNPMISVQSC